MSFVVDLLDGSDNPIGAGPLQNVLSVSITESLDQAGQVQVSLPATDYRAATLIESAAKMRVKFSNSKTAYGLIDTDTIDAASAAPTRNVVGRDLLGELAFATLGWWCFFTDDHLATYVLPRIFANTGWTVGTIDAGLGTYFGRLDGDSVLSALIKIIQTKPGMHFRMGSTLRSLDIDQFGALSTVRFTNVHHALAAQDNNANIAIISNLQIVNDHAPIVNLIIPWGAGEDNGDVNRAKVKLFHLNRSDTARWANIHVRPGVRGAQSTIIEVRSAGSGTNNLYDINSTANFLEYPIMQLLWCENPDDLTQDIGFDFVVENIINANDMEVRGSPTIPAPAAAGYTLIGNPQLYLIDAAAYAANPREATVVFSEITLTSLTADEWARGAEQLYERAKRYLDTHKVARRHYSLSVLRCPDSVRAGDKVQVVYRGVATRSGVAYRWVDIDEALYVTQITRTYNANGSTSATVQVSNVDDLPIYDTTVLYDQASQVGAMARAAG
ncbi:hypothetical protein PLCT2_00654 [Planctomycetaceae bacterium]|nr:hypothetical protein PLCT2_00654 [Planctomycetaceae bacterium]